jgi:hypothetical protein
MYANGNYNTCQHTRQCGHKNFGTMGTTLRHVFGVRQKFFTLRFFLLLQRHMLEIVHGNNLLAVLATAK